MITVLLSVFFFQCAIVFAAGNDEIKNFREAKKLLPKVFKGHEETIYCGCRYYGKEINLNSCGYMPLHDSKRAKRLEWEHIVPAEAFGRSFVEWRVGRRDCRKKGRMCAEKNANFSFMEADLYNLWPIIGELNGLRSNYSMAEIAEESFQFGACKAKVVEQKFEPEDQYKGIVARTYMYMNWAYPGHGIVSEENENLFNSWSEMHPVTPWECERAVRIKKIQKNENQILERLCSSKGYLILN